MVKGKKVKQAQLKDNFFSPKFPTTFNQETAIKYLDSKVIPGQSYHIILKDELMDEITAMGSAHPISEIIKDLRSSLSLKDDIDGWGLTYYPPTLRGENGKFPSKEIKIHTAPAGVGIRVFLMLQGTKEILHIKVETVGIDKQVALFPGEGFSLTILLAQSMEVSIKNVTFEKLESEKGHRPVNVKKNPEHRHLLIMDGYINAEVLANQAQKFFKSKLGTEIPFLTELGQGYKEAVNTIQKPIVPEEASVSEPETEGSCSGVSE